MVDSWRIISMEELYEYFYVDNTIFVKIKFPTRRWGHVYSKTSTTNHSYLVNALERLKVDGFDVKIKLEKKNNNGKFYQILINNHLESINNIINQDS
jgi:hypothetical protein